MAGGEEISSMPWIDFKELLFQYFLLSCLSLSLSVFLSLSISSSFSISFCLLFTADQALLYEGEREQGKKSPIMTLDKQNQAYRITKKQQHVETLYTM